MSGLFLGSCWLEFNANLLSLFGPKNASNRKNVKHLKPYLSKTGKNMRRQTGTEVYIYIYMNAVELLTGPSLAFLIVINLSITSY